MQPALEISAIPLETPWLEVLLIVLRWPCCCFHFPKPREPLRASAWQQCGSDPRGSQQKSSCCFWGHKVPHSQKKAQSARRRKNWWFWKKTKNRRKNPKQLKVFKYCQSITKTDEERFKKKGISTRKTSNAIEIK